MEMNTQKRDQLFSLLAKSEGSSCGTDNDGGSRADMLIYKKHQTPFCFLLLCFPAPTPSVVVLVVIFLDVIVLLGQSGSAVQPTTPERTWSLV